MNDLQVVYFLPPTVSIESRALCHAKQRRREAVPMPMHAKTMTSVLMHNNNIFFPPSDTRYLSRSATYCHLLRLSFGLGPRGLGPQQQ